MAFPPPCIMKSDASKVWNALKVDFSKMCDMCKGGTLSQFSVSISVVILCLRVAFCRCHLERVVHIIILREGSALFVNEVLRTSFRLWKLLTCCVCLY